MFHLLNVCFISFHLFLRREYFSRIYHFHACKVNKFSAISQTPVIMFLLYLISCHFPNLESTASWEGLTHLVIPMRMALALVSLDWAAAYYTWHLLYLNVEQVTYTV
eukprot:GSChrysophyteH1.ASY1.ANO1.2946.1 assembled CDS